MLDADDLTDLIRQMPHGGTIRIAMGQGSPEPTHVIDGAAIRPDGLVLWAEPELNDRRADDHIQLALDGLHSALGQISANATPGRTVDDLQACRRDIRRIQNDLCDVHDGRTCQQAEDAIAEPPVRYVCRGQCQDETHGHPVF